MDKLFRSEIDLDTIDGDINTDDFPIADAVPIQYLDARAGGGKTSVMARIAKQYAAMGRKVIICQITCALIEATFQRHFCDSNVKITRIHSDDGAEENVGSRLLAHFTASEPGKGNGEIVMCTHAGLLGLPFVPKQRMWSLIIDEAPTPSNSYLLKIADSHKTITDHVEIIDSPYEGYSRLVIKDQSSGAIRRMADNRNKDQVYGILQGLAKDLRSKHITCYVRTDSYKMLIGEINAADVDVDAVERRLYVFTELEPTIFENYQQTVIITALFKSTMLYQIWRESVDWTPVEWKIEFPIHTNGDLLTIYYAGARDFAKAQRETLIVQRHGPAQTYIATVMRRIENLFAGEPFLYSINKDMAEDDLLKHFSNGGTRLSGSPHGINDYMGWHNVAIVAALNPTQHHVAWYRARGLDAQTVKIAQYRQACYQIMMRCSLRDSRSDHVKTCVVMDKATALYLGEMFPGCAILPLPGIDKDLIDLPPEKPKGRKALHDSDASKAKAYRDRKKHRKIRKDQFLKQLHETVWPNQIESQGVCDLRDNPDGKISGDDSGENRHEMIYNSIRVLRDENAEAFLVPIFETSSSSSPHRYSTWLGQMAEMESSRHNIVPNKKQVECVCTTLFDHDAVSETNIGRRNVLLTWGVWWDQDYESDLSYERFLRMFPDIEVVIYATHSSTAQRPRWRAFMPTDGAMTGRDDDDLYWAIKEALVDVIHDHGYYSQAEISKGLAPKDAKRHGFDPSVWRPEAKIALPCMPSDPDGAIWMHHNPGRPIDLEDWISNSIDRVLDREAHARAILVPTPVTRSNATIAGGDPSELLGEAEYIETAIQDYHSRPADHGHDAFYCLACRLGATSLEDYEIVNVLETVASASGESRGRRKSEIGAIMKRINRSYRRGTSSGLHDNSQR